MNNKNYEGQLLAQLLTPSTAAMRINLQLDTGREWVDERDLAVRERDCECVRFVIRASCKNIMTGND